MPPGGATGCASCTPCAPCAPCAPATADLESGVATAQEGKPDKNDVPASYETAIVACGFGKFHYMLLLGMLLPMTASQLFSSGSTSYILPAAECDLEMEDYHKGMLNGATYLGNLLSGLLWGGFSDVFGRRKLIVVCFLLDFVVSLACAFAHSFWVMLALKVLAGFIIAGPNSVQYAYLAEVHDDRHRGLSILVTGMGFAIAQTSLPMLAYVLLPLDFRVPVVAGVLELTSWRAFLLVCALPSLWSGLWFLRLPESPKFLMSRGRQDDALGVFQRIYAANTGRAANTYPVKSLDIPLPAKALGADTPEGGLQRAWRQFSPLFRKPYLARILLIVIIQIHLMISVNSMRLWTPQLLAFMEQYETQEWPSKPKASTACQMISAAMGRPQGGLSVNGTASECSGAASGDVYLRSIVIGSVGTLSFFASGWASRKIGERPLLLTGLPVAVACCVAMLYAASSDVFTVLQATFLPATAIAQSALNTSNVDLFPTAVRGMALSIVLLLGRVASLAGNLILPFLLLISCDVVFIFLAACLGICSLLVWAIPRRGKDEDD